MINFVIVLRFNPDLMVIVINHIFTLWLRLGFYFFHCHSNTITENYNFFLCTKIGDLSGFQNVSGIENRFKTTEVAKKETFIDLKKHSVQ